jgi:hypothetical protein
MSDCTEEYVHHLIDRYSNLELENVISYYAKCNPVTIKDINILGYVTFLHKITAESLDNNANECLKRENYMKCFTYKSAYNKEMEYYNNSLRKFTNMFKSLDSNTKIFKIVNIYKRIVSNEKSKLINSIGPDLVNYLTNNLLTADELKYFNQYMIEFNPMTIGSMNHFRTKKGGRTKNHKHKNKKLNVSKRK